VEPRKNLKVLIKAFGAMRTKRNISLIIAGGFSYLYDDIISYPEELGLGDDVIFTGYVDEGTLLHLYNRALVFVYPSLYEGFGLPPLEAMSCGAPVIVSDIPPLREITGDAAMVFSPKDHEDLADKMSALLSSEQLRVEQREKGLARVREYSWEKVAGLTVRTYAKALER
jgi:glycosyltransferase involved in cell wall biosynthesis